MRLAAVGVCAIGIVLLTGCDQFSRWVGEDDQAYPQRRQSTTNSRTAARRSAPARGAESAPAPQAPAGERTLQLIGLDEDDVRARFGPPTAAEETGPGKTWRYRNGRCVLNLSFYPDVQTRVYRTLAYEVTSDDDSAERKRFCLSHFQSVARTR